MVVAKVATMDATTVSTKAVVMVRSRGYLSAA